MATGSYWREHSNDVLWKNVGRMETCQEQVSVVRSQDDELHKHPSRLGSFYMNAFSMAHVMDLMHNDRERFIGTGRRAIGEVK